MLDILILYITNDKWIERKEVQAMFSLTTKQFDRVMRNIKWRHEHDYYLWIKKYKNKITKMYINQECVDWLKEVYFNKEEHYLISEIRFYKKKISDLENELGIDHKRDKYESSSLRFLSYLFGKSVSSIHVALHRMKKVFPYPITFEDEGVICVKEEGIRWLYENYFKRDYLKELEEYKWELEIRKNNVKVKT